MSESQKNFVEVVLPLAASGTFTYALPKSIDHSSLIGKRCIVDFGKGRRLYTGLVVDLHSNPPSVPAKSIIEILDKEPIVSAESIKLWNWMSEYYMCSIGEVMNAALPGILNISSESSFILNASSEYAIADVSDRQQVVLNALSDSKELKVADISRITGIKEPIALLLKLVEKGLVLMREEVRVKYKEKQIPYVKLSSKITSSNELEEIILSLKKAAKQLKLLMSLIDLTGWDGENNHEVQIKQEVLLAHASCSNAILKPLIGKGLVEIEYLQESRINLSKDAVSELQALNETQQKGFREIQDNYKEKQVVLLHGVTSSGKTEIYAHLIEEAIGRGKQILYLLPEISLTSQLIRRLKVYFGNKVAVYHSRLSQNERAELWQKIANKEDEDVQVILGARSSIFLPFDNLGLVIVDEEHDRSFKQQDPAPRYEARDASVVLAKIHGAKVLLGSATPSLESIENAGSGKYGYVRLTKRFGGIALPEMQAVDLTEERRKRKMQGSFSSVLYNEIQSTLQAGEQIILFQNRRGYAPFIVCEQCAYTPKCRNCDVSLTLHKKRNTLMCHYCGYGISMLNSCPDCKKGLFRDMGAGTEKIEEELSELFPNIRLARFDMDSTRKKNAFQNLIDDFESKEIDVLIGTQMVTKGLDFENVGLVGIINADNMLRFPDFRSFERTYQMLTQVAGRAGRKKKQGKVIIQTYDPFHPVIQHVLSGDFKNFVKIEMKERRMFKYPPFYRILDVKLKHRDRQVLFEASKSFGIVLKKIFGESLLGPEFPYIERIRNLYSMHFVIKVSKTSSISAAKIKLANSLADFTSKDTFKSIKAQIDVDPY